MRMIRPSPPPPPMATPRPPIRRPRRSSTCDGSSGAPGRNVIVPPRSLRTVSLGTVDWNTLRPPPRAWAGALRVRCVAVPLSTSERTGTCFAGRSPDYPAGGPGRLHHAQIAHGRCARDRSTSWRYLTVPGRYPGYLRDDDRSVDAISGPGGAIPCTTSSLLASSMPTESARSSAISGFGPSGSPSRTVTPTSSCHPRPAHPSGLPRPSG